MRATPRILSSAVYVVLLAACSGGSQSSNVPATPQKTASGTAIFKIDASQSGSMSSIRHTAGAKPQYISPATQAIVVDITGGPSGTYSLSETAGLTIDSSDCTSTLASTVCTLSVPDLAPCNASGTGSGNCYKATLTTYDQYDSTTNVASGNVLSTAQSIPFTIAAGETNTIDLTLSGVPETTIVAPVSSFITESDGGVYGIAGLFSNEFNVYADDADGNIIIGPGAPLFVIETPSGTLSGITVSPSSMTTTSAPNTFTVTSASFYTSGTASFMVFPYSAGCVPGESNCSGATITVELAAPLYVTNLYNNSVTYYTANGTLEGSFTAGTDFPRGIAYDSTNDDVYVVNFLADSVTYYTISGSEVGSFSSGISDPYGIAYDSANGYLYVVNQSSNTMTYYDASGDLEGSITGLDDPSGVAYDPGSGYLYVANYGNNTVTYYDGNGDLEGSFSSDLNEPIGIAYDPANNYFYVTNDGDAAVTYYDAGGTEEGSFSSNMDGADGIAYDPDNGYLYVANSGDSVVTYYDASGTQEGSFSNDVAQPAGITVP